MSQIQKRKVLSLGEKHEIINKCHKGKSKTVVAKEYEIPQSPLSAIFKKLQQFQHSLENHGVQ